MANDIPGVGANDPDGERASFLERIRSQAARVARDRSTQSRLGLGALMENALESANNRIRDEAMRRGKLCRVEELTRIPSEVQDTLITILSEKTLPVPELNSEVQATKGFNVIATANNKDKGVNELSSALSRRFNTVVLPTPATMEAELEIVEQRVERIGRALELPAEKPALEEVRRVVTIFRELRSGVTQDGNTKIKKPSGTLSTAEAISVMTAGLAMAAFYGDGAVKAEDLAASITGAVVRDPVADRVVWLEYLRTVVKERDGWKDLYRACQAML